MKTSTHESSTPARPDDSWDHSVDLLIVESLRSAPPPINADTPPAVPLR